MTVLILQILLAILGLGATVLTWWIKNNADKKKAIANEDKKIDVVSNADDVLIELDRLRESPTNRP